MAERQRNGETARGDLTAAVDFGRAVCGDLGIAAGREWLVTNGIGGFASGTVAGVLTRRYHGLLTAALRPPLGRTLLVAKIDDRVEYDGQTYALFTNRWADGSVDPRGHDHIERFRLDGTVPVWTYACADALIEKRVWMEQGTNTTYVRYAVRRARAPVGFALAVLVNYRDYHAATRAGDWRMRVAPAERGVRIVAFDGAAPVCVLSEGATAELAHEWYRGFDLAAERARGLDDREDHLHACTLRATLGSGESLTVVCTAEASASLDGAAALARRRRHEAELLGRWAAAAPGADAAPAWIRQLVLAADQFVARRPLPEDRDALTVIAGYHWFGDWGRDTMIALPGLTLATGRPEVARRILTTFARFADGGMLPNLFPDAGTPPEYNTVDAALWYVEALRQYVEVTRDVGFLGEIFPVLEGIVDGHVRGTRHGIAVDPTDGLLAAGEPGVQLTWMDAKVGDWVVTPRIGKPVEVNALWYNALGAVAGFARRLGRSADTYDRLAVQAGAGFQRFWNEAAGFCFDVLDAPGGNDAALRPNQIVAVSLPESPLAAGQQRAVVDACAAHLLTSHGLRSLAPSDPAYQGRYGGEQARRDAAYHQGTAWGWLLGPFVVAHLRVHGDAAAAAAFLAPMAHHVAAHGLGSASEIFDGDAPFEPRGCIAQAWSVGEILRAWHATVAAGRSVRRSPRGSRAAAAGRTPDDTAREIGVNDPG